MDPYPNAEYRLNALKLKAREMIALRERISRLRGSLERMTPGYGGFKTGVVLSMEDKVLNLIESEQRFEAAKREYAALARETSEILGKLDGRNSEKLLRLICIKGLSMGAAGRYLGLESAECRRLYAEAMLQAEKLLCRR